MKNICFIMYIYEGDCQLAIKALKQLRAFHDEEALLLIDGSTSNEEELSQYGDIVHIDAPKFYGNNDRFLFSRMRAHLENSEAKLFIRIDPDSEVHKRIEPLHNSPWFGESFPHFNLRGTVGAGFGIKRNVIEALLELEGDRVDFLYTNSDQINLPSDDCTLAYYLNTKLDLYPDHWPIVCLRRRFMPILTDTRWTITHPCLEKRVKEHRYLCLDVDISILPLIEDQLLSLDRITIYTNKGAPKSLQSLHRIAEPCKDIRNPYLLRVDNKGVCFIGGRLVGDLGETPSLDDIWFGTKATEVKKEMMQI